MKADKLYKVNRYILGSGRFDETIVIVAKNELTAKAKALKGDLFDDAKVNEITYIDGYMVKLVKANSVSNKCNDLVSVESKASINFNVGDNVICIELHDSMLSPCQICEVQGIYSCNELLKIKGYDRLFKSTMFRLY